jgi:ribonuclease E
MLDSERHDTESSSDGPGSNGSPGLSDAPAAAAAPRARTTRRRTAKPAAEPEAQPAAPAAADSSATGPGSAGAVQEPAGGEAEAGAATRRPARRTRRSTARPAAAAAENGGDGATAHAAPDPAAGQALAAAQPSAPFVAPFTSPAAPAAGQAPPASPALSVAAAQAEPPGVPAATFQPPRVIFQPPATPAAPPAPAAKPAMDGPAMDRPAMDGPAKGGPAKGEAASDDEAEPAENETDGSGRRRRRRSRSRGRGGDGDGGQDASAADGAQAGEESGAGGDAAAARQGSGPAADQDAAEADEDEGSAATRRRRRKRRRGSAADGDQTGPDDPPNTVVHVRPGRAGDDASDEVQVVRGSTRLEAKRQRRREGRDSGRRRPPVITESEFLARREAVDRVMVVRQRGERTQIAVLEDKVLVEHYVDRGSHQSLVGNVYLGKVQNVLPSMEAAFVDIGKGRNAVLYAGEVNFDASGLEGEAKRIELALKSGQSVLVQVTKDPVGHKGARLTSQASLPGRYLVYVPGGSMMGISRKLPDTERTRLKQILKQVMPENAGVIVRTAAEGASEEELAHDVARLSAQWESIERKAKSASPPELLYSEPDLTIRVVRDIFNEDFAKLVVSGDDGWDLVDEYVRYVAPHLADRLEHWQSDADVFAHYHIDELLAKALERKVWLPSGGSLVIDDTEAMTVVDVNTGKFTGQGGNLEETVTRNNLEAAEEIVRQLRLRDVGGIIVIDFIDMVLESNRELVLRRLLECLARDRTKHQVAEVTSLGLVQMTRKRVGSGLLEAFSETCECCNGRGVLISLDGVDHSSQRGRPDSAAAKDGRQGRDGRTGKDGRRQRQGKAGKDSQAEDKPAASAAPPAPAEAGPVITAEAGPVVTAVAGPVVTAEAGPGASAPADAPAAAAPPGTAEAAGNGAGADTAAAEPPGGRRRRRAATREPGPPDASSGTDGQAAPEAPAAAGV